MFTLRQANRAVLDDVISRICDGQPVDWAHAVRMLHDDADQRLLAAFKIIAGVGEATQRERAAER